MDQLISRHKKKNGSRDAIFKKMAGYIWTDYKTNSETVKELIINAGIH
jgi:hypothetical protein